MTAISLEHRPGRFPIQSVRIVRDKRAGDVFGLLATWTSADDTEEGVFLPNELAASARLAPDGLLVVEHDNAGVRFNAIHQIDLDSAAVRYLAPDGAASGGERPQTPSMRA